MDTGTDLASLDIESPVRVYVATDGGLAIVVFTINILFKILAFVQWGVIGLAVATSIYYAASFLVQFVFLKKFHRSRRMEVAMSN